jgi:hypothetical protein
MNSEKERWHPEILPENTEEILAEFNKRAVLSSFYLAGGTAVALMTGHRLSNDFDFFNPELFDEETLIQKIQGLRDLKIISKDKHTLHISLKNTKISFLGYNYPMLFKTKEFHLNNRPEIKLKVADVIDISCMKISSIAGRGIKRDFIDLYVIAQQFKLIELFSFFQKKYSQTPYNKLHILKSLTYFNDAESEPMPDMLINLKWEDVKKFFLSEVPKLL